MSEVPDRVPSQVAGFEDTEGAFIPQQYDEFAYEGDEEGNDPDETFDEQEGLNPRANETWLGYIQRAARERREQEQEENRRRFGVRNMADQAGAPLPTITVGGQVIEVRPAARAVTQEQEILYPKEDRATLSAKELLDLYTAATKTKQTKYKLLTLTLTDNEKLDDTYVLEMAIQRTKHNMIEYDMHDVFTIMYPDGEGPGVLRSIDLFHGYSTIKIEDVAKSNEWYRRWPTAPSYDENLKLTFNYFQNNVADDLCQKANEEYNRFPISQRGGPLFFIIMMNLLLSNTDAASEALVKRLRNLDLSKVQGEDVDKVVSLSRGAIIRLQHIQKLPADIVSILIDIFQTSSVPDFNSIFKMVESQRLISQAASTTGAIGPGAALTYDQILNMASTTYRALVEKDAWSGADTKGESIFKATGGKKENVCWNCGKNHLLPQCPEPRNENKIQAAKEAMKRQRGQRGGGGGRGRNGRGRSGRGGRDGRGGRSGGGPGRPSRSKFGKPESWERNKRIINGTLHLYDESTKRWNKQEANLANQESGHLPPTQNGQPSANIAGGTAAPAPAPPSNANNNENINLALANFGASMQTALSNLQNQF